MREFEAHTTPKQYYFCFVCTVHILHKKLYIYGIIYFSGKSLVFGGFTSLVRAAIWGSMQNGYLGRKESVKRGQGVQTKRKRKRGGGKELKRKNRAKR